MAHMKAPRRPWRFVQLSALLLLGQAIGVCAAQPAATPAASSSSGPSTSASLAAPASRAASAPAKKAQAGGAHVQVIEDDNVRIEESRVRGQPQRITVHNKSGRTGAYEIIVPGGGKDSSQDRGAAGQRAWSLFAF